MAALVAVLFGASQSKFDIAIYGVASAVVFYFMGAVLHYLSDILHEVKGHGKEAPDSPETTQNEAK
ncbi:MAG: hypothetical protein IKT03_05640 [Muribaculaceae bacterium]|nr:hypothetical protein [Muribaculaceae bacterium]